VTVSIASDGDTLRIRVGGELDAVTVSRFVPVVNDLLQGPQRSWILNLSELSLIDSSGVGSLIYAFKKLRERGGNLSVVGAVAQPLAILQLMRLDHVFVQSDSR
jgi:anti-anti-sigma factor